MWEGGKDRPRCPIEAADKYTEGDSVCISQMTDLLVPTHWFEQQAALQQCLEMMKARFHPTKSQWQLTRNNDPRLHVVHSQRFFCWIRTNCASVLSQNNSLGWSGVRLA